LSPWQVKILLKETAREDTYTGEIPETGSTKWGFGKVNAYFAVVRALQTTGVLDLEKPILWKIYPNPTSEILYLKDLPADDFMVQLVDLNGRLITELKNPTEINVENLAPGTYLIRLIHDNKVEQQKFVVQ
jgi:gamma-glutamyl:cysteine ligase YbdK (ATP-grasp superfamily)